MSAPGQPPSILYADDYFLVVDKPAGLVVHPTYKNTDGTLLDILRQQLPEPPSIVGRLDRLTSGLVVVARNGRAHAALQRAMQDDDCHKDYLAVVHGEVSRSGEINLRLRVSEQDRRRVVASTALGAPSRTRFAPIATTTSAGQSLSLLRCQPVTGRRHQIRVHLSSSGWPIVGDPVYGRTELLQACARQALHAWRLELTHPYSGARLQVTSPIPADLEPLIRFVAGSALDAHDRDLGEALSRSARVPA